MELLDFFKQVPMPVLIFLLILMVITLILLLNYLKNRTLEGMREDVYHLFLKAEHTYAYDSAGKQKLTYVVSKARSLLPTWLQLFITDTMLMQLVDKWFVAVKDLLDDGKVNGSTKKEGE